MRERWYENIVKLRLVNGRGEVRCVRWRWARQLKRAGIPHPYRFLTRLGTWRTYVAYIAAIMVSFAVFGAIQGSVLALIGLDMSLETMSGTKVEFFDFLYKMLIGTGAGAIWLVFAIGISIKFLNRSLAPRYRHGLLAHGKCPWCLYDLSGSVKDEDGLTTCPECGGVWKMGDVPACGG